MNVWPPAYLIDLSWLDLTEPLLSWARKETSMLDCWSPNKLKRSNPQVLEGINSIHGSLRRDEILQKQTTQKRDVCPRFSCVTPMTNLHSQIRSKTSPRCSVSIPFYCYWPLLLLYSFKIFQKKKNFSFYSRWISLFSDNFVVSLYVHLQSIYFIYLYIVINMM